MKGEKFSVGLLLYLDLPTRKAHIMTPLLGWETDAFLISKYPFIKEKPLNIKTGDQCVVRFIKDGAAYGFQTAVLSMQFHPAPLLFFKYPERLESMPFRKHRRYVINIPAKVLDARMGLKKDASVLDISEGGCLLSLSAQDSAEFEAADEIYLTFKLMDANIEIDCKVRNTRVTGERLLHGIEFTNQNRRNAELISTFIDMISAGHG